MWLIKIFLRNAEAKGTLRMAPDFENTKKLVPIHNKDGGQDMFIRTCYNPQYIADAELNVLEFS